MKEKTYKNINSSKKKLEMIPSLLSFYFTESAMEETDRDSEKKERVKEAEKERKGKTSRTEFDNQMRSSALWFY